MYPAINPDGPRSQELLASFRHLQPEAEVLGHVNGGTSIQHRSSSSQRSPGAEPAAVRACEPTVLQGTEPARYSDSDIDQEAADSEAWTKCAQVLEEHHQALVKRWRDDIDTLLVYAGLFSAVLTAFNVELYSLLQPDTMATHNNAMLAQLVSQSNGKPSTSSRNTYEQTFVATPSLSPFHAAASSVWVNTLWFSSLICSLSAASLGMMVKQWLHETELGLSGTSRDTARLRQLRIDSLVKWRVGAIVALLPVLLQIASALFLAGLLIFLWTLHRVVATVASTIVAVNAIFILVTLFAPAFSEDCAYRSLQSLVPFLALQAILRIIRRLLHVFSKTKTHREPSSSVVWGSYRGWAGLERAVVRSRGYRLDAHAVEAAHILKLDDIFTQQVLLRCAHTLPHPYAGGCIGTLIWNQFRHLGTVLPTAWKLAPSDVDITLTLAFDAVRTYLNPPATVGAPHGEGLNDVTKSLQVLQWNYQVLIASSSKLGGQYLRDLASVLNHSIALRHKKAEAAALWVLKELILSSPWSRVIRTQPVGLHWEEVLGQDRTVATEVIAALSQVIRKGSCRQDHQLRFEAYFSLIKIFGISYVQDPPAEVSESRQPDDRYPGLPEVLQACIRDLSTISLQPTDTSLSRAEDARTLLSQLPLSQLHPQTRRTIEELCEALESALKLSKIPWFVTCIVAFRELAQSVVDVAPLGSILLSQINPSQLERMAIRYCRRLQQLEDWLHLLARQLRSIWRSDSEPARTTEMTSSA
ncbi:hypothetical protein FKP32DRAFT_1645877 [Trametes sanguinea]|nr:hypothetical protein FKP32DRAFT_1645877 [Trametes sanguinea]